MSLDIEQRDREGIVILDCKGRLVLGSECEEFRERTRSLVEAGKPNLILAMIDVDHIDSSGLGEMVNLAQSAERKEGRVKLLSLNQKHVDLLVITKLSTIFDFFEDEQDAINSFFPDRKINTFDLLSFVHTIQEEDKNNGGEPEQVK